MRYQYQDIEEKEENSFVDDVLIDSDESQSFSSEKDNISGDDEDEEDSESEKNSKGSGDSLNKDNKEERIDRSRKD